MKVTCRACGNPSDAALCRACTEQIQDALTDMPRDLADLQAVATRQAVGPLGLGDPGRMGERRGELDAWAIVGDYADGSLGDAPWDFAPGAADQLWAAANTLGTWMRHLADARGIPRPDGVRGEWVQRQRLTIERNRAPRWLHYRVFVPDPEQPISLVIGWLLTNIDAIRQDESAAAIHDEIIGLQHENQRWALGRAGQDVFAGNCDATQVGFEPTRRLLIERNRASWATVLVPVAATCGVALYGHEGEEKVRCTACGTAYLLEPRLEELRTAQINDQLARAHAIADALTTLEEPLGRELLRKWIQRDADRMPEPAGPACERCRHQTCQSIRRPPILAKGSDDAGHPLYRFGDVRRRLAAVQEQRGAKLTA